VPNELVETKKNPRAIEVTRQVGCRRDQIKFRPATTRGWHIDWQGATFRKPSRSAACFSFFEHGDKKFAEMSYRGLSTRVRNDGENFGQKGKRKRKRREKIGSMYRECDDPTRSNNFQGGSFRRKVRALIDT